MIVTYLDTSRRLIYSGSSKDAPPASFAHRLEGVPPPPTNVNSPYLGADNATWESGDPDREARGSIDHELVKSDAEMVRRMEDYFLRPEVFSTLDQEFKDRITSREDTRVSRRALRQSAR